MAIVNEHAIIRGANPYVVPPITVPEVTELLKQHFELGSRQLAALVAAKLAAAAWNDENVKKHERFGQRLRKITKEPSAVT